VTELKEAATATAPSPTSAGQPQSPANGTQNTEAHRQHTQHARPPHEAANQPSPKTQPKVTALENSWRSQRSGVRALKQLLIIVGVIVAAILVVSIILSNSGPKLKVQARVGSLSIQNVGSEPITIRHLSVNDRPDCKIERPPIDLLVAPPGEARTLKVGDAADWIVYCPVVRLTVETNLGTATYTFD
jgi:hypothetical protein